VVNPERIKKMAEKNGYITEEVSAKTGEKVYDSIKNFGMGIARAKMEKSGFNWYANSPSTTPSLTNNSSNPTQLVLSQEPSPPKTSNESQPRSSSK
jgi:hypothetical protein